MKVSIITVCLNSDQTIESALDSVLSQTHKDIEYIVIDGSSTDNTMNILRKYECQITRIVSEPDNGIYDAMNKGIKIATGEIIGILNADDYYPHKRVIEEVAATISRTNSDSCYADVLYVQRNNLDKVVRYWKSGRFSKRKFKMGWMPHHGTFYVKRQVFEKYGVYRDRFPVAADYELMLRFLYKYGISTVYIPDVLLKIRTGGASKPGLLTTPKMMVENYRAWKVNGLNTSALTFILKPLRKIAQYIKNPG